MRAKHLWIAEAVCYNDAFYSHTSTCFDVLCQSGVVGVRAYFSFTRSHLRLSYSSHMLYAVCCTMVISV